MFVGGWVGDGLRFWIRRTAGILARQVLAQLGPALAAVRCIVEKLICVIERVWVSLREDERLRPRMTIRRRVPKPGATAALGSDVLRFSGHDIATPDCPAEENLRMQRN